jgi:hypothetical protein
MRKKDKVWVSKEGCRPHEYQQQKREAHTSDAEPCLWASMAMATGKRAGKAEARISELMLSIGVRIEGE